MDPLTIVDPSKTGPDPGPDSSALEALCVDLGPRLIDRRVARIIIGLGAQKAATTWMHRVLSEHRDVLRAPAKELHFWDDLYGVGRPDRAEVETAKRDAADAKWGRWADVPLLRRIAGRDVHARRLRAAMYDGAPRDRIEAYLRFLQFGYRGQPMLMDVSPAYALLPASALRAMAALHPGTVFVFLMRDPAERLWSAVGMSLKSDGSDAGDVAAEMSRRFRAALADPSHPNHRKCRYDRTLDAIDEAGVTGQSHLAFYEDLFTADSLARLAGFLSVDRLEANTDRAVNAGRHRTTGLPDELRAEAHGVFAPTYEAVAKRMGSVPGNWAARDR